MRDETQAHVHAAAPPRELHRTPVGCAAAAAILAVPVALLLTPLGWLLLHPPAKMLLEELALPRSASDVSDIELVDGDGTLPETAQRSFRFAAEDDVQRFYVEACVAASLELPDVEALQLEPELLCRGWRSGRTASVSLWTRCERDRCSAFVSARIY